jgi:hypothetical protein
VAGGYTNTASGDYSTVPGGYANAASGFASSAMGFQSIASGYAATAMGFFSLASGNYSTAMGASYATGYGSIAMGFQASATGTNSAALGYLCQATNNYATALGYQSIAGGFASTAIGVSTANGDYSTALGSSVASNYLSTAMGDSIAGGQVSTAMGFGSFAGGDYSIAGGYNSAASGNSATAFGTSYAGGNNSTALGFSTANGYCSTAAGNSAATGADDCFAAGYRAQAIHTGTFVWADQSQVAYFSSTAQNQFLIRATGGVGIGLNNPAAALHVASQSTGTPQVEVTQQNSSDSVRIRMESGGNLGWEMDVAAGASPQLQFWYIGAAGPRMTVDTSGNVSAHSFNSTSDRNAKENFQSVNVCDVLEKVAALPITRWDFKDDSSTPHIGPMAQDFHAAFNVGTDDRHIATVDEDGVALAAIQGLNQKLDEKDAEIRRLEQNMAKLQELVAQLAKKQPK